MFGRLTGVLSLLLVGGLAVTLVPCRFDPSGVAPDDGRAGGDARRDRDTALSCLGPDAGGRDAGVFVARHVAKPPIVDGDLADWACVAFAPISEATAGLVENEFDSSVPISGEFAVLWDEDALYLGVRITDPEVAGSATEDDDLYRNDSVELFLDGDGLLTGTFEARDHHFILDHEGRATDYSPNAFDTAVFQGKATTTAAGYAVEIRVAYSALGTKTLDEGQRLGFDLAINEGDGAEQYASLVWYLRPRSQYSSTCTCSGCCCTGPEDKDRPYCNSHRLGHLLLWRP